MTSKNEWYVYGDITGIDDRKRSVVVTVKGKIFRPEVYKVRGMINCVMTKEQYKSLNIYEEVELTGHIIFGKDNYLMVESIKNKMGFLLKSSKKDNYKKNWLKDNEDKIWLCL